MSPSIPELENIVVAEICSLLILSKGSQLYLFRGNIMFFNCTQQTSVSTYLVFISNLWSTRRYLDNSSDTDLIHFYCRKRLLHDPVQISLL